MSYESRNSPVRRWLRSFTDRCRECGFHPPTQGHEDGCPVWTPRRKRK